MNECELIGSPPGNAGEQGFEQMSSDCRVGIRINVKSNAVPADSSQPQTSMGVGAGRRKAFILGD